MSQILSAVSQGLFWYLGLALLGAVLLGVLRSPRFKGWRGERAVQASIRRQLNPLTYVDLHNVTLPTKDGSTQIDHLIFSPYGLFVLETKNYQGWIFGGERQAQWTQQIFKKRSRFQNPLRQNYKHIKTLEELLGVAPEHVHSVIAFVGECEFKTEMPPNVTRGHGFVSYIQSFSQQVWGPEQMQDLLDKLEELRLQPGRATHKKHVEHVQELQASKLKPKPKLRAQMQSKPEPVAEAVPELAPAPASIPAPAPAAIKQVRELRECPQCTWPLRKLVMQRGPLAGQGVWRCTNQAVCGFVQEDARQR